MIHGFIRFTICPVCGQTMATCRLDLMRPDLFQPEAHPPECVDCLRSGVSRHPDAVGILSAIQQHRNTMHGIAARYSAACG